LCWLTVEQQFIPALAIASAVSKYNKTKVATIMKISLPLTLIALGLIYYFSFDYIYSSAKNDIVNQQIQNAKVQAMLASNLLAKKLESGYSQKLIQDEFQKSIENMSIENSFVCMFDSSGREICHPDQHKVGKVLEENNSVIESTSNESVEHNFKKAIQERKSIGGLRKLKTYTEIVYLSPVKKTGWVVASHSNILKLQEIFIQLREKLILIFLLIWLSSSLLIYFFLQRFNSTNLAKLSEINRDTGALYFNELRELNENILKTIKKETTETKRLLVDKGSRLKPVDFDNIAIAYTENKMTYIIEFDNNTSTVNTSLDELFNLFDKNIFYRASRQVIIAVKAIDKIEKYGNTQLKVITKPDSPIDIIISKAKITEFKKWAGKN